MIVFHAEWQASAWPGWVVGEANRQDTNSNTFQNFTQQGDPTILMLITNEDCHCHSKHDIRWCFHSQVWRHTSKFGKLYSRLQIYQFRKDWNIKCGDIQTIVFPFKWIEKCLLYANKIWRAMMMTVTNAQIQNCKYVH